MTGPEVIPAATPDQEQAAVRAQAESSPLSAEERERLSTDWQLQFERFLTQRDAVAACSRRARS